MNPSSSPLVSVILPAHNAERFLARTLKSVLEQTYSHLEILLVDDGSRDRTWDIAEAFARQDDRIKLFHQCNLGVAAARNLAIRNSRGKYIAPVDADDLWLPAKIEKQVQSLESAPAAGLSYVWCLSVDERGCFLGAGPHWDLEGDVYEALVLRNFIGNASIPLFRREPLLAAGGYNEEFKQRDAQGCEDWDLCLRLAERCEFRVVKEYLAAYRCHTEGMSFNHEAMGRSYRLVLEAVRSRRSGIPPEVFRWSQSLFYLYLTNKSNMCGDLRNSLKWLLRALREDKAVLLLPWVNACLIKSLIRLATTPFMAMVRRDQHVWRQFRRYRPPASPRPMSFEDIQAINTAERRAERLWDQLQVRRWSAVTKHRSFSCC